MHLSQLLSRAEFKQRVESPETMGEAFDKFEQRKREAFNKLQPWDGKTYYLITLDTEQSNGDNERHYHLIKANSEYDALGKLVWTSEVCREDVHSIKIATIEDIVGCFKFIDDCTEFAIMVD